MKLEFDEMYSAFLNRDSEYDGLFLVAVKTTGVFCRSICSAKKPLKENVSFFEKTSDALAAGYRPCKKCMPMDVAGKMPAWLEDVIEKLESDPARKWKDYDIRQMGIDPTRVRRWFLSNHGITFHAFLRSRRLSAALSQITLGHDITQTAQDAGYESISGFRTAFQQWFGCPVGSANDPGSGIRVNRVLSPLGPMIVAADEEQLYLLEFADRKMLETQFSRLSKITRRDVFPGETELMQETQTQLNDYFEGIRQGFDLPLFIHGSEFQDLVWNELLKIEYGETCSYEEIATRIGKPSAQRAVGKANGDNRLAIVVPCHRVIRQNGELSGYGGGVRRKEWMLQHEKAVLSAGTGSIGSAVN